MRIGVAAWDRAGARCRPAQLSACEQLPVWQKPSGRYPGAATGELLLGPSLCPANDSLASFLVGSARLVPLRIASMACRLPGTSFR
jgi:hypothetical protein